MDAVVHLVSQRAMGTGVSFRTYDDDQAEAAGVARRVGELVSQGVPLHSIAVLYRTNSQSEALEQAFSDAGISFVVHGGARFFDRDEVRRTMLLLRREAVAERLRGAADDSVPAVEPGTQGAEHAGRALVERVQEIAGVAGWTTEPPSGTGAVRERWDNLNALVDLARERDRLSLPEFVAELEERWAAQAAPAVAGVTFSTLHAAKGLEWDAVFLVGVSEGLLPISMAQTLTRIEEERRLLYVGVTRARDHLEISWARARSAGHGRGSRTRSRFLDGIWPDDVAAARRPSRVAVSSDSPRHRAKVLVQEFEDQNTVEVIELFHRLREWRSRVAKAVSKPAYTVLADQTLRDVAVARPKTLRQLGIIRGIGAVKLDQYGAQVLAVVRGEDVPVDPPTQ